MRRYALPVIGLLVLLATPLQAQEGAPAAQEDRSDTPTFTPYDEPPKLGNSKTITRLLADSYPFELRAECNRPRCATEGGPSGTVVLWLYIDEQGVVQKTAVQKSSGYESMDEAGRAVAKEMEFSPAEYEGEKTAVWFTKAITFKTE